MAAHQALPSLGFSRQEHWSGLLFPSPIHESEKWKWSRSVVSDSSRPHGLQPSRLLHPWHFPGKSTGVSGLPLPSPKKRLDPIFQRKFYANPQYMKEIRGLHSTVTNPFPFLSAKRPRAVRRMWGLSREQTEIHYPSHVYQGTVARKG